MKGIVTYTSSNKRIAMVSKNRKVEIKDTGIVVIKINASGNNEYKSASVKITINVSPKKPSLILTKLKRNQRYYVRICAYKKVKVGGKSKILRSAWCKAKRSGKIK